MNTSIGSHHVPSTASHGATSRRHVIAGAAAAASLSFANLRVASTAAQRTDGDLAVMAQLLKGERRASELFRAGLTQFTQDDVTSGDRLLPTQPTLSLIWQHERRHLNLLTSVVTELGGTVRLGAEEASFPDFATFLFRAAEMKREQVATYLEAISSLEDAELRALAAQILVVESQHAAHLNERTGQDRFWPAN